MKKKNDKKMFSNALSSVAAVMLTSAANRRCAFIYHQPKQPEGLKKFRRF